jgi:hypothetical protein
VRARALGLATVVVLCASAVSQEAAEWERDVDAVAPGEDTATTLIVDELTREPIPGARITWYAEMEGLRAPALGTAVANAYGMATLDWTELATWDADGHFLVTAEGYAAAHEFGKFPPEEVEMVRGRDVTARVVDLLGRPVADADVEVFLGCGHGPILDFVQTDADGRVTVSGQDADEAQLWAEAPGTAADYLPLDDADGLGSGERVLLLAPGGIAEGVVLDSAGRPLEGVEVRSFQRHRGPVGMTDRRGRFRLVGVEDEASLYFGHPHAVEGWAILEGDRWRSGVPLRLHLTPWGFATPTQDRARVVLRARGPDGRVLDAPEISLLGDADGVVYHADEEEPSGVLRFDVPPGLYVPVPSYRFAAWDVEPTPVNATAATPPVTLRATPRPQLRVEGTLPDGAHARVGVEGAEGSSLDAFLGEEAERIPADGPVVVAVTWLGRAWFFPAGPEEAGARTVRIDVPQPNLLRLPEDLRGEFELLHDGVACEIESVDEGFVTFATGELVLRVDTGESLLAIPVALPAGERSTVDVGIPESGTDRLLRVIPPDGTSAWMDVTVTEESGGSGYGMSTQVDGPLEIPVNGPAWVRVERDDHVVWQRRVEGAGDVRFAWGDAAMTFRVVDDGGDNVQVTVLVDGVVVPQRDPDDWSIVRVLGLEPGPHTILLLPRDDVFLAKELRVVLQPGETRRKRVRLTER